MARGCAWQMVCNANLPSISTVMSTDHEFLRHAIRIAQKHMELGHGGPFGAVVVSEEGVIFEGWNQVTTSPDPTAHAEIVAIRKAAAGLSRFSLKGCTLYASCEPCPMCLAASYWARLDRVVFAATRHDAALAGFDDEVLYQELALPVSARSLSMQSMLRDEAVVVFDQWRLKADKVPY